MSDESNDVVVFETGDSTELQLARNLIEEEGIPCSVRGGDAASLLGAVLGPQFVGFHELLVPADCVDRATQILAFAWRERPTEESS